MPFALFLTIFGLGASLGGNTAGNIYMSNSYT